MGTPASLHRYTYGHQNPQTYTDPDGRSATIVLGTAGFFWGAEQMATAMYRDLRSSRSRSSWEYIGLWGRNIYGGLALGASIDLAAVPALSGAAGLAGLEAMTLNAEAGTLEEFVRNNNRAALEGAAWDLGFRAAFFAAPLVFAGGGKLISKAPGAKGFAEQVGRHAQPWTDRAKPWIEGGRGLVRAGGEAIRGLHDDVMRALRQPSSRRAPRMSVEASGTGERPYLRTTSPAEAQGQARAGVRAEEARAAVQAEQRQAQQAVRGRAPGGGRVDDVLGPHRAELRGLHKADPDFFPNPDTTTFRVVQGDEALAARAAFNRSGLRGHHVHPIEAGGPAVPNPSGLAFTGESTIKASKLEGLDVSFFERYGNPNAKRLKIHQAEPGGIIQFGGNPRHTRATSFWAKVRAWQRRAGLRE